MTNVTFCLGLEAAEARGVLHRDVKAANCFVDREGTVKVGDFGLSISTSLRGDSNVTSDGTFLGTPAFSSPEQLRGDDPLYTNALHDDRKTPLGFGF